MSSFSQGGFFLCKLLELSRRPSAIFPLQKPSLEGAEFMGKQSKGQGKFACGHKHRLSSPSTGRPGLGPILSPSSHLGMGPLDLLRSRGHWEQAYIQQLRLHLA